MGPRRSIIAVAVAAMTCMGDSPLARAGAAVRENGRTFIVDQRGERWDVTQAQSLGFDPDRLPGNAGSASRRFVFANGRA